MIDASTARLISIGCFELDEPRVEVAIQQAAKMGELRVEFDCRRWNDRLDDWLEGLGYTVTHLHMLAPNVGNAVEVSW